jgi:hypothetical protein
VLWRLIPAVQRGCVVHQVPLGLCLSHETALQTASASKDPALLAVFADKALSDEDAIAYLLLLERAKGEASAWAPYIASLPAHVPQGAFLNPPTLALLGDDALASKLRRRGSDVAQRFAKARSSLRKVEKHANAPAAAAAAAAASASAPAASSWFSAKPAAAAAAAAAVKVVRPPVATLEAWRWALGVVSSRALTFRGKRLLAPICDMYEKKKANRACAHAWAHGKCRLGYMLWHVFLLLNDDVAPNCPPPPLRLPPHALPQGSTTAPTLSRGGRTAGPFTSSTTFSTMKGRP